MNTHILKYAASIVAVTGIVVVGVVTNYLRAQQVLLGQLASAQQAESTKINDFLNRLEQVEKRLSDMKSLRGMQVANSDYDNTSVLNRLNILEAKISALQNAEEQLDITPPLTTADLEMRAKERLEGILHAKPAPSVVARQYSSETGKSEWGTEVEGRIDTSFGNSSFFNTIGGTLLADCRQSACVATWTSPDLTGINDQDFDQQIGIANYELLDVVTRNNPGLGPLETSYRQKDGRREITVHFTRQVN